MDRNDERYGKDWQLSYRILSCEWLEDLGYYEVSVELLFKGDLDYEVDEISFSIIKDRNKYYFTEGMRYLFLDIMVWICQIAI